jgi:hypothetical protein
MNQEAKVDFHLKREIFMSEEDMLEKLESMETDMSSASDLTMKVKNIMEMEIEMF